MSVFAWKAEYSVGSAQIDLQHKQIFRMAAELHNAMVNGQDFEVIEGLLDRFVAYTRHHFSSEERFMQASGYPGYQQHHDSHEKLAIRVDEFHSRLKSRKVAVPMELTRFLRDWMGHHVREDDMMFGVYLKSLHSARTG